MIFIISYLTNSLCYLSGILHIVNHTACSLIEPDTGFVFLQGNLKHKWTLLYYKSKIQMTLSVFFALCPVTK